MKTTRRIALTAAIVATLGLAVAAPAAALTYQMDTAVSCDGNTIKNAGLVDHYDPNGDPWYTTIVVEQQAATTQSSSTRVFFRSTNGNDTGTQVVSTGGRVLWPNVIYAKYYVMAYRTEPKNCNGILPGNGNYRWVAVVNTDQR